MTVIHSSLCRCIGGRTEPGVAVIQFNNTSQASCIRVYRIFPPLRVQETYVFETYAMPVSQHNATSGSSNSIFNPEVVEKMKLHEGMQNTQPGLCEGTRELKQNHTYSGVGQKVAAKFPPGLNKQERAPDLTPRCKYPPSNQSGWKTAVVLRSTYTQTLLNTLT